MNRIATTFCCIFLCASILYSQNNNISKSAWNNHVQTVTPVLLPDSVSELNTIFNEHNIGITTSNIFNQKFEAAPKQNEIIEYQTPNKITKINNNKQALDETKWILKDSITVKSYLPANQSLGAKLNYNTWKLDYLSPYDLIAKSITAVKKSPKWLRPALEYTLSKLNETKQAIFADLIINTEDPFIDEVAFAIAYSTPTFLNSAYCFPNMFLENAQLMYGHDPDLEYVDIVDYGSSTSDENYYSTVKYWRIDTNGIKYQVEVPKDIYYMDIVHPKATDEIQTYINPEKNEHANGYSNHTLNIEAPEIGKFWRDFIYTFTEVIPESEGLLFPILKDSISQCSVLWDDRNIEKQAIKVITKWINDVMDFNSDWERPHQPIRIYKLHLGRCGEHEDLTIAASRSCLVPCRGIEAYSSDHVWNEFWDEKWEQWEPVNNSYKDAFCYSKGWGKKFGSLVHHQSNGVFNCVTPSYVEHTSTLIIKTVDKNNRPIDGARVMLAAKGTLDDESLFLDTYGITDDNGICTFIVEAGRTYYTRMYSSVGNIPTNTQQVSLVIENAIEGKTYTSTLKTTSGIGLTVFESLDLPNIEKPEYRIDVDFAINGHVIKWLNEYDDISGSYTICENNSSSTVNLFYSNEVNFLNSSNKAFFSAYNPINQENQGKFSMLGLIKKTPAEYCYINNSNKLNNSVIVDATFKLYAADNINSVNNVNYSDNILFTNYPNPVAENTSISFYLPWDSQVKLYIINNQGNTVRTIINNSFVADNYSFNWDTKDDNGNTIPNGIYYMILATDYGKYTNKIAVIK